MIKSNKLKTFNDPIYGFIAITNSLIYNLIEEPCFQRLRRISQMGLSNLVYPGAHHTRFHHALGSMHIMKQAIDILKFKNVKISSKEEEGLLCAILLHDIGHGPFSHAMENSLVEGVQHEEISLKFMHYLNAKYKGKLDIAIEIFTGNYHRKFLNQLVSSQLDMDRLDYLKRDSFYTGVAEGNINSERLITMLNVVNGQLVVEEKGIYSVEKFLMARRFMYWQVYLHKTALVGEQLLIKILKRAKSLIDTGYNLPSNGPLSYFLNTHVGPNEFDEEILMLFSKLDDIDVWAAIKGWVNEEDFVLSNLCKMLVDRKLPHIKVKKRSIDQEKFLKKHNDFQKKYNLTAEEADYFVFHGKIKNQAYNINEQNINILSKNGKLIDVAKGSDHLNIKALAQTVTKYYVCYPKKSV